MSDWIGYVRRYYSLSSTDQALEWAKLTLEQQKQFQATVAALQGPDAAQAPAGARSRPSKGFLVGCAAALGLVFLLMFLVSRQFSSASRPTLERTKRVTATRAQANVVFDLPKLLGGTVDDVRGVLGTPEDSEPEPTREQMRLGVEEWNNSFTRDGQELLVTFNPRTRRVIDYFLPGDDVEVLMNRGNLRAGATTYRVEPIRSRRSAAITGIKVVHTQ